MKNRARIFLVCFILVGGTALFAFQSLNRLNNALDDISATNLAIANASPNSFSDHANTEQTPVATPEIIGASTTSTDLGPSFIFPKKGDEVYAGCTYSISFQSLKVSSLTTALIDAGSRDTIKPTESGLASKNNIEPVSQSFNWKVGMAFHGEYYIKATSVNGAVFRSDVFNLKWFPRDISDGEKEKICRLSGGSF